MTNLPTPNAFHRSTLYSIAFLCHPNLIPAARKITHRPSHNANFHTHYSPCIPIWQPRKKKTNLTKLSQENARCLYPSQKPRARRKSPPPLSFNPVRSSRAIEQTGNRMIAPLSRSTRRGGGSRFCPFLPHHTSVTISAPPLIRISSRAVK